MLTERNKALVLQFYKAFATMIQKSQRSEYPVVVLPVFMQHYVMLSRNLIYTGLTRARKLMVLVGDAKVIGLAVKQVKDQERYTLQLFSATKL